MIAIGMLKILLAGLCFALAAVMFVVWAAPDAKAVRSTRGSRTAPRGIDARPTVRATAQGVLVLETARAPRRRVS